MIIDILGLRKSKKENTCITSVTVPKGVYTLYKVQKKRRRKKRRKKTQTNKTKNLVNLLTFCFHLSWGKMDMIGRFRKLPITMTSKTVEKKRSFHTLRTEACKCSPVANFLTSKHWITTYSGLVILHRRAWRMKI